MAHFEEKSGIISCPTPWGSWYQTMEEVVVEILVPNGTKSKEIKAVFGVSSITCTVRGIEIKGELYDKVIPDECLWSLEDRKLVRIILAKCNRQGDNCWKSLLKGQYQADPYTYDQMEKKMTLQKFQYEHPGFDFSHADITGNYAGGGPNLSGEYM